MNYYDSIKLTNNMMQCKLMSLAVLVMVLLKKQQSLYIYIGIEIEASILYI